MDVDFRSQVSDVASYFQESGNDIGPPFTAAYAELVSNKERNRICWSTAFFQLDDFPDANNDNEALQISECFVWHLVSDYIANMCLFCCLSVLIGCCGIHCRAGWLVTLSLLLLIVTLVLLHFWGLTSLCSAVCVFVAMLYAIGLLMKCLCMWNLV